jgi:hypothetical protein
MGSSIFITYLTYYNRVRDTVEINPAPNEGRELGLQHRDRIVAVAMIHVEPTPAVELRARVLPLLQGPGSHSSAGRRDEGFDVQAGEVCGLNVNLMPCGIVVSRIVTIEQTLRQSKCRSKRYQGGERHADREQEMHAERRFYSRGS